MALTAEKQALFDHAKGSLPRFLTSKAGAPLEWLYAFVEVMDSARAQVSTWLEQSYLSTATGRWLEQHARDRGTSKRAGESDDSLRARLRQYEDMLTDPAMRAAINAILTAASGVASTCEILWLRRYRAHCQTVGESTAFLGRGYRMANATTPTTYIVILPTGTTDVTVEAVKEYLRQFGPAGYQYLVERPS